MWLLTSWTIILYHISDEGRWGGADWSLVWCGGVGLGADGPLARMPYRVGGVVWRGGGEGGLIGADWSLVWCGVAVGWWRGMQGGADWSLV
jgi:hypothetical protein